MNRIGSRSAAAIFVALAWTEAAIGAGPLRATVTVGQLIADPDKFGDTEVVVRGYIEISDLWRSIEAVHNLYDSKAVVDQLGKDWKTLTEGTRRIHGPKDRVDDKVDDAVQEMKELDRKFCITVLPVEPFRRGKNYLSNRTVIIRGHLEKYGGIQGCNQQSGIALIVDEVLYPPAPLAKLAQ